MHTFLMKFHYTSGSWARMMKVADDRTVAVRALMEAVGGRLVHIWWDVGTCSGYTVAELPDAVSAAAVLAATAKTGAFTDCEAHELLTEDQLHDAILLAKAASDVYSPPGKMAAEVALEGLSAPRRTPR